MEFTERELRYFERLVRKDVDATNRENENYSFKVNTLTHLREGRFEPSIDLDKNNNK